MSTDSTLRSKWVALALATCANCQGSGMRTQHGNSKSTPCNCVLREIFRVVLTKFRECATGAHLLRPFMLQGQSNPKGRRSIGRKQEEFSADLVLAAQRTLTDQTELSVFRYFHLLGADWKLCCRKLAMDRGSFYHTVYRVEQKLGCVFLELRPYALYPVDEYFGGTTRPADVRPIPVADALYPNGVPLRPPLAPRPVAAPAPDPFEAVKEEIRAAFRQGQTLTAICNDLNQRGVLPKHSPSWYPALLYRITGPRAPEAMPVKSAPAPAPASPIPMAPFDIADAASIAQYSRKGFRQGRSLNILAAELTRLSVPAPNGNEWRGCDVKHLLMTHPRETARSKRAA